MTVYHDFDTLVSFAVAMMAYRSRHELHIYDIDSVIKAARCYYWAELLLESAVEDSDVPTDLVRSPDPEFGPIWNLWEMAQALLPHEQDTEIARTVEDMHRHIYHIVVDRDPSEFEKMGPTDIAHAIIESDYAHIAGLQKEIQVKLSTMPTFRELDTAWFRTRHSLNLGMAEVA